MRRLTNVSRLPLVLEPASTLRGVDVLCGEREQLLEMLTAHGALLLRGFEITHATFPLVVDQVLGKRLDYVHRSTPRRTVGDLMFTATEYPADRSIPFHSEEAYQRSWPLRLAFFCQLAPSAGGETPLADVLNVTRRLPAELLSRFRECGVRYIRNYIPGMDLPWTEVFQAATPAEVEAYCDAHGISCLWRSDGTLRTEHTCQGVAKHPLLHCEVFFNQAHLFHISSLPEDIASMMLELFDEGDLPRHATFGDGAPLTDTDLNAIRSAFEAERVEFTWETGDLLLVDNMQVAHARNPFSGRRSLFVAMAGLHCPVVAEKTSL